MRMVLIQSTCRRRCVAEKFDLMLRSPCMRCTPDEAAPVVSLRVLEVLRTASGLGRRTGLLFNYWSLLMKAKRRSPVMGPLLTFGLMLGSVAAVVGVSRMYEARQAQKSTEQTVAASANDASHPVTRQ